MASGELNEAVLTGCTDPTVDHGCRLCTRSGDKTRVATACFRVCLSPYAVTILHLTALQFCMGSNMINLSFHSKTSDFTCYTFWKTS